MSVRERLVEATTDLIRRHGVEGTGVSDILEHSGVARRSIYLNFPSGKGELVAEATRSAGRQIATALRELMSGPSPRVVVDSWISALRASDFQAGCPLIAAALARPTAPEAADAANDAFGEWVHIIAERLSADGVDDDTATSLATTVVAGVEGAIVISQARRSTAPLTDTATHLNELIAMHLPATGATPSEQ
ncbi:TetR/AcrR family transcriptional regulator [Williamsia sterculiae]|uniref:Transcriptional regulator, TetR family n=1 Tax=Williamsia sterculiae TaxID=1344003 RepID=A0A1N7DEL6_9NOCA|nr:TetR/AcrR family transcriptional regulator [Williamsia sterculiae]SIR74195.1 transcriptional regulator, TetR family [Williamsia sterculiae]